MSEQNMHIFIAAGRLAEVSCVTGGSASAPEASLFGAVGSCVGLALVVAADPVAHRRLFLPYGSAPRSTKASNGRSWWPSTWTVRRART